MERDPDPWGALIRSVERRRSHEARFFKPALLIAVIDLMDEGAVDPSDIDPGKVMDRFTASISHLRPERSGMLWRPLFHLSNDGAWQFSKNGARVGPDSFGRRRKPDSTQRFFSSFDGIAVAPEMLAHWRSPEGRRRLRAAALDMLARDDAECQELALMLSSSAMTAAEPPAAVLRRSAGQGFETNAEARRAVEARAMAAAASWLAGEGWTVSDHTATDSYDLFCSRAGESAYVEVKGTTGAGDAVIVTRAEVQFALEHRDEMILVVVAGIELGQGVEGLVASGGVLAVRRRWAPDPNDLRPISFVCRLRGAVA